MFVQVYIDVYVKGKGYLCVCCVLLVLCCFFFYSWIFYDVGIIGGKVCYVYVKFGEGIG